MFKQPLADSNKNTTTDHTTTTDINLNNSKSDTNTIALADNDMSNDKSLLPTSLKHILNHENIEIKLPKPIVSTETTITTTATIGTTETTVRSNDIEDNNENKRPRRNRSIKRSDSYYYPSATNAYRLEYKEDTTENDVNIGVKRINNSNRQQNKKQRRVSTTATSSNNDNILSTYVGPGKRKKGLAPRWYTQSYMIFLALREHPTHCLARTPLIKAALALDEKISKERGLPRVFRSRTPANSASAVLTVNSDRYFIPFKPKDSRSTYFKLAYEPCDFNTAVSEYDKWMEKLVQHDWLYCFGTPKPEAIEKRRKEAEEKALLEQLQKSSDNSNNDNEKVNSTKTVGTVDPLYTLDELDLSNVPKRWQDILKVDKSNIEGAGDGLFATQKLPYNSPLGFYFGVPMTEDEFDSMKENVGKSSEYSIMYRKTVLDATDENGQPYTDVDGRLYCPFHFMNDANKMESANILFVEGYVVNQVICWTKRDIHPGEELLVWYGKEVNRYWSPSTPSSLSPSSSSKKSNSSPSTSSPSPTPSLSISSSSVSIASKNDDEESS